MILHVFAVVTVEDIKCAIANLSVEERAELVAELCGWANDEWDEQMRGDAANGKFAALNTAADGAEAAGATVPLATILNDA